MDNNRLTSRAAFSSPVRWIVIAAVAALAASCGLHKFPAHGNGAPGAGRTAVVPRCRTADMKVRLDLHAAGVAAGTCYLPLDFTEEPFHPGRARPGTAQ